MNERREVFFWLMLVLAAGGTFLYVQRQNLYARYLDHQRGAQEVRDTEEQCQALEAELDAMRERVANLGNDSLEIEESIRHNKGYVRPGETVFRIQKDPKGPAANKAVETVVPSP